MEEYDCDCIVHGKSQDKLISFSTYDLFQGHNILLASRYFIESNLVSALGKHGGRGGGGGGRQHCFETNTKMNK